MSIWQYWIGKDQFPVSGNCRRGVCLGPACTFPMNIWAATVRIWHRTRWTIGLIQQTLLMLLGQFLLCFYQDNKYLWRSKGSPAMQMAYNDYKYLFVEYYLMNMLFCSFSLTHLPYNEYLFNPTDTGVKYRATKAKSKTQGGSMMNHSCVRRLTLFIKPTLLIWYPS